MSWEIVKLDSICSKITDGAHFTPTYVDSGIPFLRVTDIQTNNINWNATKYIPLAEHEELCKRCKTEFGDILFSKNGTIGKVKVVDWEKEFSTFVSLATLKPLHDKVLVHYLAYFLKTPFAIKQATAHSKTGTVTNLHLVEIRKIKIPLPPLETQKRIVSLLDKAHELIDKRKEQIALMDQLVQSLFYDMFGDPVTNPKGWEQVNLKNVATVIMGQSPSGDSYNSTGEGSPLLNGPTEFGKRFPIAKQWTTQPRKMSEKNDILFCVRGATAGRMNISNDQYCLGRGLASIRVRKQEYFEFVLLFLKFKYEHFQNIGSGSTFINISKDQLNNLLIILPSLTLQNTFAERVQHIEAQKEAMIVSLKELEDNFNSLMQRAFKGEI
jgi:type I restriction enzyme, S subunit